MRKIVKYLLDCWGQLRTGNNRHAYPRKAYQKKAKFARNGLILSEYFSSLQDYDAWFLLYDAHGHH
jgi:hypothetical protein